MRSRSFVRDGGALAVLALVAALTVMAPAGPASASSTQLGQPEVVINPDGGTQADESDGIRFTLNGAVSPATFVLGSDQIRYRGQPQWRFTGSSPVLRIGTSLYGQAGIGNYVTSFTSLDIVATAGSTRTDGSAGSGSGSATLRYTAVHNTLTYTVDRLVSYTYPNNFVTESYAVTIPTGNTDVVGVYLGGDAAPGGNDSNAVGIMLTSPRRQVISLNPSSGVYSWFRQVPDGRAFDGATSQTFNVPYVDVLDGDYDIGFVADPAPHDAGLMLQWTLGSTPGAHTFSLEQGASIQDVAITESFRSPTADAGETVLLDLDIVNTMLIDATDDGVVVTLPTDLTVAAGVPSLTCPAGTVTAVVGSGTITLAGLSVTTQSNCVASVPVSSTVAGTYTLTRSSAVTSGGLRNSFATTDLTVAAAVPGPPTALVADPGDSEASIAFDAAPDNGSPLTNYESSTDDGGTWTTRGPASTTTPIVLTGLDNDTAYVVRLRAINAVGTGAQSASVTVTPLAAETPTPPPPVATAAATTTTTSPPVAVTTRTAGVDRYATAAAFNADLEPGIEVAYIATGALFPDALAAGPVAGIEGAALLLVEQDAIPAATANELSRLRPVRIVVIGGVAAVSSAVAADLDAFTEGDVTRIAGIDRYGTALALSGAAFTSAVDVVHLASGAGFTDAVSAGPAAGFEHGPVLLVQGRTLDDALAAELLRLTPDTVVIGGGADAVDPAVEAAVAALLPDAEVVRAAGVDRYATSVAIAERVFSDDTDTVFVATGLDFADALGATPAAVRRGAAMVLVPREGTVPDSVLDALGSLGAVDIVVVGGTAAVPQDIVGQLRA